MLLRLSPLLLLLVLACGGDDGQFVPTPPNSGSALSFQYGSLRGRPYVLVAGSTPEFYTGFYTDPDGGNLELTESGRSLPVVLEDAGGTRYDLYGLGSGGTNDGLQLEPLAVGTSLWLTPSGMYPGISLNNGPYLSVTDTLSLEFSEQYDVPTNGLYTGTSPDIIASLDDPRFLDLNPRNEEQVNYLREDDWVLGIRVNGEERLYPGPILTAHEIVNDVVGGERILITYSPLSASARVWKAPAGTELELGVSGMLWNSCMLMFDRNNPDDLWHQVSGSCISGGNRGRRLEPVPYLVLQWSDWRSLSPRTRLLLPSPNLDISNYRNFDRSIRGSRPHPYFVDYRDPRLPTKEIVVSINDGEDGKAFTLDSF